MDEEYVEEEETEERDMCDWTDCESCPVYNIIILKHVFLFIYLMIFFCFYRNMCNLGLIKLSKILYLILTSFVF